MRLRYYNSKTNNIYKFYIQYLQIRNTIITWSKNHFDVMYSTLLKLASVVFALFKDPLHCSSVYCRRSRTNRDVNLAQYFALSCSMSLKSLKVNIEKFQLKILIGTEVQSVDLHKFESAIQNIILTWVTYLKSVFNISNIQFVKYSRNSNFRITRP